MDLGRWFGLRRAPIGFQARIETARLPSNTTVPMPDPTIGSYLAVHLACHAGDPVIFDLLGFESAGGAVTEVRWPGLPVQLQPGDRHESRKLLAQLRDLLPERPARIWVQDTSGRRYYHEVKGWPSSPGNKSR